MKKKTNDLYGDIGEVYNSEEIKKLRMDMLNGKRKQVVDITQLITRLVSNSTNK